MGNMLDILLETNGKILYNNKIDFAKDKELMIIMKKIEALIPFLKIYSSVKASNEKYDLLKLWFNRKKPEIKEGKIKEIFSNFERDMDFIHSKFIIPILALYKKNKNIINSFKNKDILKKELDLIISIEKFMKTIK